MLEIVSNIEVAGSAEQVWSALTNFAEYPRWNSFIPEITGVPEVGRKLKVLVRPVGSKGMTFQPEVLVVTPNQELRWRGRLLLPGLFDGEHYFIIAPLASGKVRFIQGERFSGLLVPLARKSLEGGTKAGFAAMNEALKERVEASGP